MVNQLLTNPLLHQHQPLTKLQQHYIIPNFAPSPLSRYPFLVCNFCSYKEDINIPFHHTILMSPHYPTMLLITVILLLDREANKVSVEGLVKDKDKDKDKDNGVDNVDNDITKDEPIITGTTTDDVVGAIPVVITTTATPTTTDVVATAAAVATTSDPLPLDLVKVSDQNNNSDNDVLLAPLDASLSSVDLLLHAAAARGKNNRIDLRGLGSGNLYLSSSSEFERGTEGAISEGMRSLGDSCEFEYSLPAPPVKSQVKSSSQMVISPSNTMDDDVDVESYLFDPVVQHLWSRLCHVREEMNKYAQQ